LYSSASDFTYALQQHKQWKTDIRFGTWNVRSLYRSRSLKTVARQLVKYRVYLVGQRLDGTREAPNEQRIIHLSMGNENH